MNLTEDQKLILESKYKLPEETTDQWLDRIALAISDAEKDNKEIWRKEFRDVIESMLFLPGGSILTNAGVPVNIEGYGHHPNGGLNNCSALWVGDSIEDIARAGFEYAVCAKHRFGLGVDLTPISYKGRPLRRTKGKETASGVVSMMKLITGGSEEMSLGGCLHGDTLIYTDSGLYSIRNLVTNRLKVRALTHEGWKPITQYFSNGIKEMWDVYTKNGHYIRATKDHKFCYLDSNKNIQMKPLKDFSQGEKIISLRPLDYISEDKDYYPLMSVNIPLRWFNSPTLPRDLPISLQEDFGYWLGIVTFRGYLGRNLERLAYPNEYTHSCINIMIREKREEHIINRVREISQKLFFTKGSLLDVKKFFIINIQFPLLATWIVANELDYLLTRERQYNPNIILHSPISVQRNYLAGIFDTNGSREENIYRIIASDCRVLKFIQNLLLSHGISSKIIDAKKFKYDVGWIFNLFIKEVNDFLEFINPCHILKGEKNLYPEVIEDEIAYIEKAGEFESFDLEIEGTHKYVADGLYVSNSRRSAGLMALRWDHQDAIHFINCKRGSIVSNIYNSESKEMETIQNRPFHNVNLSILLDESFWIKLKDGDVLANKIWDEIALRAWEIGEPGVIFIDNINRDNPLQPLWGDITIGNACFSGDTLIAVADGRGVVSIKDLAEQAEDFIVYCYSEGEPQIRKARRPRMTKKNTEMWVLTLKDGSKIKATPNHKVMLADGSYVELKDLKKKDNLMPFILNPYYGGDWSSVKRELYKPIVESVEFGGYEDVYNFSVDEFHNYCIICKVDNKENVIGDYSSIYKGIVVRNCSEIPMYSRKDLSEVCALSSIILPNHLKLFGTDWVIDFDKLRKTIKVGVRFLDNVLDVSYYPLEKMRKGVQLLRRLGLGVTGFADVLMKMGISYGSPACISFVHILFSFIRYIADEATEELGKEKGNFPMLEEINKIKFFAENKRNIATLALAPTGSVTPLSGCFGYSIEPIFGHVFVKQMPNIKDSNGNRVKSRMFLNPYLPELTPEEYRLVMQNGTLEGISRLDKETKQKYLTTREISIEKRLAILSSIQRYIDNGISTTVNLPASATVEDIQKVFQMAHELDIKAVTIYRDTSLDVQAINYGNQIQEVESCSRGKG